MEDIQQDEPPIQLQHMEEEGASSYSYAEQISLRRLVYPDDLVIVKKLHYEWFPIKYGDEFYTPLFQEAGYSTIQTGRSYAIAAVNSTDTIVGLLTAQCMKEYLCEDAGLLKFSFGDQDVVYITTLGVVSEYRGRGIATRLLEDLITKCTLVDKPAHTTKPTPENRSITTCNTTPNTSNFPWFSSLLPPPPHPHAVKAIYLHVLTTNNPAIHFYEKSKFMKLRMVPYFYEIDNESHDSYLYILYLNDGHPPSLPNLLGIVQNKLSCMQQAASSAWFEFTSVFCL